MSICFDYTNVIWENYVTSKLIEQMTFVSCIIIFVKLCISCIIFWNCLEMTPAALKCQLNAVELCNLETTVFFNPLSLSIAHP